MGSDLSPSAVVIEDFLFQFTLPHGERLTPL